MKSNSKSKNRNHVGMVLGYHNPRLSILAVDSILANPGMDAILVEPDAREKDLKVLRERYGQNPRVVIIPEKENKLCAWGMNQGIKEALLRGYDLITLMNDDATIDEGYAAEIEKAFTGLPMVGIAQPKTMFGMTDVIYSAGVENNWAGFPCLRGFGQRDTGQYDKLGTEYASMVICTLKTQLFHDLGLLDEDYIQYYDDIDFSIRAKKAGYRIVFCPRAVSRHHTLGAIGQSNSSFMKVTCALSSRNKLLMAYKNGFLTARYVLFDALHAIKWGVTNPHLIPSILNGKVRFLQYVLFNEVDI